MRRGEVVAIVVVERADKRDLVDALGHLRHQRADVDAGYRGLPDAKRSAKLGRRSGLGSKVSSLARPAVKPDENDRLLAAASRWLGGLGAEIVGQDEPGRAEKPGLEGGPAQSVPAQLREAVPD